MKPHSSIRSLAVIGMGRSGTTLVTKALASAGAFVGEVNWAYEHLGVRAINDELLARFCGALPGRRPYGHWQPFEIPAVFKSRATGVVSQLEEGRRAAKQDCWAIKDPRTTLLSHLWLPLVDVAVGVFRHPGEVTHSYLGHRFVSGPDAEQVALAYWLDFNRILLDLAQNRRQPFYLLEYGPHMDHRLAALSSRLGLSSDPSVHFEPAQQHYHSNSDRLPAEITALHQQLQRAAQGARRP